MNRLVALLCCMALGAQAETFDAKVIAVMDGDTVMVLRNGKRIKIRMANIDAPEKEQAFGVQSRASLLEMVGKRQVRIDSQAVDQYGRVIAFLAVDGLNVNEAQVRRGMAWEYSYHHSDRAYLALQQEAQQARRGLWSQATPSAPWLWRKTHPAVKPDAPQSSVPSASSAVVYDATCAGKRSCAQMDSCAEAYFYLTRCGVATLDGNRNGIPCESLCPGGIKP